MPHRLNSSKLLINVGSAAKPTMKWPKQRAHEAALGGRQMAPCGPDHDEAIRRLQAVEKAGADVLYAPGLRDLASMKTVVESLGKPLNVVMSSGDPDLTADQIAAVGVKRISVGGALSRLAMAAFMNGARAMKGGSFAWMREAMATSELKKVFLA